MYFKDLFKTARPGSTAELYEIRNDTLTKTVLCTASFALADLDEREDPSNPDSPLTDPNAVFGLDITLSKFPDPYRFRINKDGTERHYYKSEVHVMSKQDAFDLMRAIMSPSWEFTKI